MIYKRFTLPCEGKKWLCRRASIEGEVASWQAQMSRNCLENAPELHTVQYLIKFSMNEFHGYGAKDRIYRIWYRMRQRCSKDYADAYGIYKRRGITVCEEWDTSFPAFLAWAESSGYDDHLSLDRIDGSAGYSPSNCRWSTAQEQSENRSVTKTVTIGESTRTVKGWANFTGICFSTLYKRYDKGVRGPEFIAPPRAIKSHPKSRSCPPTSKTSAA